MPGMSGPGLQRELTLRRQEIPIVFIAVYGDGATVQDCSNEAPWSACPSHSPTRPRSTRSRRHFGYRLLSALSRHSTSALDSNGFLSKQTAPTAAAFASSPGSTRAVIMMTGILRLRHIKRRARSNPLMPGMCTSVITQSHDFSPSAATNSSAEMNARAAYPSEPSDLTSALRNGSSSSMTATEGSLDTLSFPTGLAAGGPAPNSTCCHGKDRSETIQGYYTHIRIIPYGGLGLSTSAMRTRSARVLAPIFRIAAPR